MGFNSAFKGLNSVLDMGGWSTPRSGHFTPGKTSYPLHRRLGGFDGRSGRAREILPPPGFDLRIVQPVASRYTDYDLPAHRGIAVLIRKLGARSGERSAAPPGHFILEDNPQHPPTTGLGPTHPV
jgi:hypothetical protein